MMATDEVIENIIDDLYVEHLAKSILVPDIIKKAINTNETAHQILEA